MLVLAFFATAQASSNVALPLYPQAPTHEELAANLAQWLRHADEPQNGEINIQVLEVVGAYAKPFLRDGGSVILVAHAGAGDTGAAMNKRRLHNIRAFLTGYPAVPENAIVATVGEPVSGLGRVDIYVGGKLVARLSVKGNRDLRVTGDDIDPRYY